MRVTTDSFKDGQPMPTIHSAEGEGSLPVLQISDVPNRAVSLAVVSYDPDVPRERRPDGNFDHWVVWNIPADTTVIADAEDHSGVVGRNTLGENGWVPAGPPPGSGPHRYYFTVYALDTNLDLSPDTTRADLEKAIVGHVVESAQIMGTYETT